MTTSNASRLALLLFLCGCPAKSGEVGELPAESGSDGESMGSDGTDGPIEETAGGSTGDETDSASGSETGAAPAADCSDLDADGVPLSEDNAPDYPNPLQIDSDADGIADVIDLCPLVGGDPNNTADSDRDGIGNACDLCAAPPSEYPFGDGSPEYMRVRTLPLFGDLDGDGVGDACDNCPTVPNCYDFGAGEPFDGTVPEIDGIECQADTNANGIGDACEGELLGEFAAGPVGFDDDDDFDQDGLSNALDACPRQPLGEDAIPCTPETAAADCGPNRSCAPSGICNHLDTDGDAVGDACDTCAYAANPIQVLVGGADEDDPDGDSVGAVCELGEGCRERRTPARVGRHPVAVGGSCCTVELVADAAGDLYRSTGCADPDAEPSSCTPLLAPDQSAPGAFIPVRTAANCSQAQADAFECVALPAEVETMAGVLSPPPGCDAALQAAGLTVGENLEADLDALESPWANACRRPQFDVDFDGLGDACDFCTLAFDPSNQAYVDETGRLWPNDGAICNGDFRCE